MSGNIYWKCELGYCVRRSLWGEALTNSQQYIPFTSIAVAKPITALLTFFYQQLWSSLFRVRVANSLASKRRKVWISSAAILQLMSPRYLRSAIHDFCKQHHLCTKIDYYSLYGRKLSHQLFHLYNAFLLLQYRLDPLQSVLPLNRHVLIYQYTHYVVHHICSARVCRWKLFLGSWVLLLPHRIPPSNRCSVQNCLLFHVRELRLLCR